MRFEPLRAFGNNQDSIPFFQSFAAKYSATMSEVNSVFYYSEDSQSSSPFSINGCALFFNQSIWDKLNFTNEELEAMLAHEIGHAIDTLARTKDYQPERENHADDFAITLNLGNSLCSALKKCISSKIFSAQEVESMTKRIIRIRHESFKHYCYLLKGIHSEAKNKWLIAVNDRLEEIMNMPFVADRIRILEEIASHINGIGPTTIDETLTWFDNL